MMEVEYASFFHRHHRCGPAVRYHEGYMDLPKKALKKSFHSGTSNTEKRTRRGKQ